MVVIFLGFDGVLHPYAPWPFTDEAKRSHFQHLPRLESVLRDYPETRIVIASDWRFHYSVDEIRAHFSLDIQPRVIGITALERPSGDAFGHRHRLAERFLSENGLAGVHWIAVDATEECYEPSSPMVLCWNSFDESAATLLRQLLSNISIRELIRGGDLIKPKLLEQAGGFLCSTEVSELLGATESEVETMRAQRLLLAPIYRRQFVYPRCQFSGNSVDPCLEEAMPALAEFAWQGLQFLLTPQEALAEMTPLSAFRSSDADLREIVMRLVRILEGDGFA